MEQRLDCFRKVVRRSGCGFPTYPVLPHGRFVAICCRKEAIKRRKQKLVVEVDHVCPRDLQLDPVLARPCGTVSAGSASFPSPKNQMRFLLAGEFLSTAGDGASKNICTAYCIITIGTQAKSQDRSHDRQRVFVPETPKTRAGSQNRRRMFSRGLEVWRRKEKRKVSKRS